MATGRPRTFDVDEALDIALKVFWCKGYEGTSIGDLTKAMGINRPSLYCAFGNKEQLFRKALDRYAEGPGALYREAIGEPTVRASPSGSWAASPTLWATRGTREDACRSRPPCPAGKTPIRSGASSMRDGRPARRRCASDSNERKRRVTCRRTLNPPTSPATSRQSPRGWRFRRPVAPAATTCGGSRSWRCEPGPSRAQGRSLSLAPFDVSFRSPVGARYYGAAAVWLHLTPVGRASSVIMIRQDVTRRPRSSPRVPGR